MTKLNKIVSYMDSDLIDMTVSNQQFKGVQGSIMLKNMTFEGCIFKGVNFDNIVFEGVDFIDCVLEDCDLSNKSIDERLIKDTVFKSCKLSGVSFINSFIKNTEFNLVNGRYINMSGVNINDLKIFNSDFSESSFVDVKIKKNVT